MKPKKIPCRISWAIKISRGTTQPVFAETVTNLQIVLNTQKALLKSSYPKNTCQNFLTQKNPEIENSNLKKSLDHPGHLKSRVPPWAPVHSV